MEEELMPLKALKLVKTFERMCRKKKPKKIAAKVWKERVNNTLRQARRKKKRTRRNFATISIVDRKGKKFHPKDYRIRVLIHERLIREGYHFGPLKMRTDRTIHAKVVVSPLTPTKKY